MKIIKLIIAAGLFVFVGSLKAQTNVSLIVSLNAEQEVALVSVTASVNAERQANSLPLLTPQQFLQSVVEQQTAETIVARHRYTEQTNIMDRFFNADEDKRRAIKAAIDSVAPPVTK